MAAKYWIKLYHEMLDDPKIGRLPVNLKWRFIELLLMAGEVDADGFLPPLADMAWRVRVDESTLQQDMLQFQAAGMVEVREYDLLDNRWFLVNFSDRQGPSPAAARMREMRKRQRKERKEPKERKEYTDTEADTYRAVTHVTKRNTNVTHETSAAAAVFSAFEQVCGMGSITAIVSEEIGAFVDEVGSDMVIEAINEAAVHNKRSWAYVRAILKNWRDNGKGAGKPASKPDIAVLFSALQKPYQEARAELEAAGAWPYVERMGRWEDLKRKPQRDLEFAWRAA